MLKKYSAVIILALIAAIFAATFIAAVTADNSSLTFRSEQPEVVETVIM